MDIIDTDKMHPSWQSIAVNSELEKIDSYLVDLKKRSNIQIAPANSDIMRFATTDLSNVRLVVVGQDPYNTPGAATGRAFEVADYTSWLVKTRQSSLNNILKLLYKSVRGHDSSIEDIRKEISTNKFVLPTPDQFFSISESNGVLWLNTALTVELKNAGSHTNLWSDYMCKLFQNISHLVSPLFLFWGKSNQRLADMVSEERKIIAGHPSRYLPNTAGSFAQSDCFNRTAKLAGIDWFAQKV